MLHKNYVTDSRNTIMNIIFYFLFDISNCTIIKTSSKSSCQRWSLCSSGLTEIRTPYSQRRTALTVEYRISSPIVLFTTNVAGQNTNGVRIEGERMPYQLGRDLIHDKKCLQQPKKAVVSVTIRYN